MKFISKIFLSVFMFSIPLCGFCQENGNAGDTAKVKLLTKKAYEFRKSDPAQTIIIAQQALELAKKTIVEGEPYKAGMAEAYRTIGVGYYYTNDLKKALDNYLPALALFEDTKNELGKAKVDNNIGNLYQSINPKTALYYMGLALNISRKLNNKPMLATMDLNIGSVYFREKEYNDALTHFLLSKAMFEQLGDKSNLVSAVQNTGVAYFWLHQYDKAKEMLIQANKGAKELDASASIASIDLTLSLLYIADNNFTEAEKYIDEGTNAALTDKIKEDYEYTRYQLEIKRKNYEKAVYYLKDMYSKDSIISKQKETDGMYFQKATYDTQVSLNKKLLQIEKDKNTRYLFIGSSVAAGLLMVVIVLLVLNVKRKNVTNLRLTELNQEVSRQKDNVDRINQHLEEIIDERTKDLQIKNKKLSEYSSYLSHQIRGPIATLKGLINLEKEGLVDTAECVKLMDKCVSEIDERIITTSEILHDPEKVSF